MMKMGSESSPCDGHPRPRPIGQLFSTPPTTAASPFTQTSAASFKHWWSPPTLALFPGLARPDLGQRQRGDSVSVDPALTATASLENALGLVTSTSSVEPLPSLDTSPGPDSSENLEDTPSLVTTSGTRHSRGLSAGV
ncbi:hypothetical protein J3458_019180 [Metarhizium acridum]|uniref:uncharacterized protein n=1 Tax=Metarhizium acridum TaxID=92637 RepID=UPI001C6C4F9A|nr:hypothetical protein J3458_019180 [Metarhizium acridum]